MIGVSIDRAVPEWHVVGRCHPHVLLTGTRDLIDAALGALLPQLRLPLCQWPGETAATFPDQVCTLLVREVATLSLREQQGLLDWLDNAPHVQVVSTSPRELFPLVERGTFLTPLYYRLNVLRLDVITLSSWGPDGPTTPATLPSRVVHSSLAAGRRAALHPDASRGRRRLKTSRPSLCRPRGSDAARSGLTRVVEFPRG
jgi:hypothetical protein